MKINDLFKFLLFTVQALVDSPNDIQIRVEETDEKVMFIVAPRQEEVGQLIGERGCIANAIRVLLRSLSTKWKLKKVYLYITEPKDFKE